jgi:hypothetical protein
MVDSQGKERVQSLSALLVGLGRMYVLKCVCNNTSMMRYAGM